MSGTGILDKREKEEKEQSTNIPLFLHYNPLVELTVQSCLSCQNYDEDLEK